ncbi:MAG: MXAN_6640 family putative metalloprotease [Actinomycetota bacterium]
MNLTRSHARAALGAVLVVAVALPASAATPSPRGEAPGRDPFASTGTVALASAKRQPALVPTRNDALRRALDDGALTEAEYALARARSLFHPEASAARYGDVTAPRRLDATLVLRDLAIRQRALHGAKLERARAILGRPTEGNDDPSDDGYSVPALNTCGQHACVTWVPTSPDAPDDADADGDQIPDWVEQTAQVVEEVWDAEVGDLGYRAPKDDSASSDHGPDGKLDVYIANLGDDGLYGYCTSDDPNLGPGSSYEYWDTSAYCVVDDDYREFPLPGLPSLQVTVAHEFFHAVQFAYDAFEDAWLMEGTASWMEDEVYTDVNDNLQYLADSQLSHPEKPLDFGTQNYLGWYGSWIFFRFLEEYIADQPDPSIVRAAWEAADGAQGGPDKYSAAAIGAALKQRKWEFRWAYADFGAWNLNPDATYAEGEAYPSPPLAGKLTVRSARPNLGPYVLTMDHMTTGYVRLKPGSGVAANAKLRVSVDGPDYARGPEATLVVEKASGALSYVAFELNANGDGAKTVKFGKGKVASVTLVLTNASIRFACWKDTRYSCQGKPKDDDTRHVFDVALIQ